MQELKIKIELIVKEIINTEFIKKLCGFDYFFNYTI